MFDIQTANFTGNFASAIKGPASESKLRFTMRSAFTSRRAAGLAR
jgi:hypothetical protein